jgi:hypothetical protein
MSDPTRIARDAREASVAASHRAAAPLEPDADALERVRMHAGRRVSERAVSPLPAFWRRPVVWRTALVGAAAVAILGASFALVDRSADVAFAKDRLLAVLAPAGTVLHYVEHSNTNVPGFDRTEYTTEHWIDAAKEVQRAEFRNPDGEIESLKVESDGRARYLSLTRAFDESGDPIENGPQQWMLMETPADNPLAGGFNPLWWLDRVRDAVATGDAKVTGTKRVNGERCWELEWEYTPEEDPGTRVHFSATVRQSDYRPVEYSTVVEGDGRPTARYADVVTSWELLPSGSVDPGLFDRDALGKDLNVTVENRIYRSEDLADFQDFDVWWLGPEFESRRLAGQPSFDGDGSETARPEVYYNWMAEGSGLLPFARSGELVITYSADGIDRGVPDDIRIVVIAGEPENRLADLVTQLRHLTAGPGWSAGEVVVRETGGRRYVEVTGGSGADATSVALLNLGDSTVAIVSPDSATTARVIAALVKAN